MEDWQQCRRLIQIRFNIEEGDKKQKYIREGNPTNHLAQCEKTWKSIPGQEWTHRFIHTLDTIPKNQYLKLEMCIDIEEWEYITQRFQVKFTFQNDSAPICTTLQVIKKKSSSK